MDISHLGKTFDQIEQEVQKIEIEIKLYQAKIIKLSEKNFYEKVYNFITNFFNECEIY